MHNVLRMAELINQNTKHRVSFFYYGSGNFDLAIYPNGKIDGARINYSSYDKTVAQMVEDMTPFLLETNVGIK